MSKLFNEPIRVHQGIDTLPDAFIWRRRLYRVEDIFSQWREPSAWWDGEEERQFIRVAARNGTGGIYELYEAGGNWFLNRVLD